MDGCLGPYCQSWQPIDERAGAGEKGKENKPLRKATVALLRALLAMICFYHFWGVGTDQRASDVVPASHSKVGGFLPGSL
jgi:hypothetical protein